MFDTLPQTIVTASILPFISTDDWLQFRVASRNCYEIVHGTTHVSHAFCPICQASTTDDHSIVEDDGSSSCDVTNEEAENLWKLALVREYRFDVMGGDDLKQSIHSPNDRPECEMTGFLMTRDMFTAPSSFISWKHWRKIEARRGVQETTDQDNISGVTRVTHPSTRRCTNVYRQVVGPYYLRAACMWKLIEEWCNSGKGRLDKMGFLKRDIKQSLTRGLDVTSPSGPFEFEDNDVITALSAVYSFYAGQTINALIGLFGGYSAYDTMCMMEWLDYTRRGYSSRLYDRTLVIARDATHSLQNAIIFLAESGSMLYANRRTPERVRAIRDQEDPEDSVLRWFEEYARRISSGYYSIGQIGPSEPYLSILHYPSVTVTTYCSRAVTRGVEVVASSTYHPFSNLADQGMHIYSIRLRLLTSDDGDEYLTPEERGFSTCQLHSRHWIITKQNPYSSEGTTITEEVKGEVTCECSQYQPLFSNT